MDVLTISACGRCLAVIGKLILYDERASEHPPGTWAATVTVPTSVMLLDGARAIRITDNFPRTRAWLQFESRSYAPSVAGSVDMMRQPGNQPPSLPVGCRQKLWSVRTGPIHTPAHQPKISGTTCPCSTILMGLPMGLMCSCSGSIFSAWQNVLNRSGMERG